jgi:hypothetical protein
LQFKYGGTFRNHLITKHPGAPTPLYSTDEKKSSDNEIWLNTALLKLDDDTDYESCSNHDEEKGKIATHDVTSFSRAGEPIGDGKQPIYDETHPLAPFHSEKAFNLTRWFIQSGTSRDWKNRFFVDRLSGDSFFLSSYTMMKEVDRMYNDIGWTSWNSGEVDLVESGNGAREERDEIGYAFFYRDIVVFAT